MRTNFEWFEEAKRFIPGGVNSPVRAYAAVGGTPRFLAKAQGAYVTDIEGREYVDLVSSWGPLILGHAHPKVIDAVINTAHRGMSYGAPTTLEVELAELVCNRICNAQGIKPVERLRLVSTGTESCMTAIRLARCFTGRDLIVKFSGHYHGHADPFLIDAGSGLVGHPSSGGVPESVAKNTLVVPYNDLAVLEYLFEAYPNQIACIITEACPANMGVIPPDPGFNARVADLGHSHGALIIFDEVITGFRVGSGGFWALETSLASQQPTQAVSEGSVSDSAYSAYVPDLFTFAKVLGGGLPIGAIGGRAEIMDLLSPSGPVYQAGTLSGNPLATAAGLATLRLADSNIYEHMNRVARALINEIQSAFHDAGVPCTVQSAGNLFGISFSAIAPRDFTQATSQEHWRYSNFFHSMLNSGVLLPPSVYEAWFVSAAFDDRAIERVVNALPDAVRAAGSAPARPKGFEPPTF
ncbi:glutamate-1-semialdehyde 2,1-aminomutase [Tropheryma whipplei]|uniref:Glutamate-1-semialdehyde 2,1-aminomutase n=2 Tax=Tropheryma whipplei TaxID=2039 RepID=GSA_TROWT|nr:glutamate-1-semialdehyde 2,1-aminomutase [Tropheryma whipplei]Q83FJ5.1 RecName: Full=Glutamate-1-semialdehyde 2,1-aminomutase; Short=GSA; AltName: Full=Glutamate-1-semialdehyde aminotransferase; Short=GSA-AT [Tropheryma whipplei str. Twist]Q83H98.1 RecName: Full=Glutamate-1-semialdehyde 2,1-aminomutase; Short=GSA; AltName: Full=Glutamate-1-semialdehyde aminotransferase; Short=GSA-AT [Tropheryma whipplei TW08/27]AAO44826.1 glutamate-1-semialdehyde 2,1-aminomutase [Tropheryma whipplei str. Twis